MTDIKEDKKVIKISQQITGFSIAKDKPVETVIEEVITDFISMNETIKRPTELAARSYKIKPPTSDQAFYLNISDIILNEGTEHEERRPFEIFINTKNVDSLQWMSALTILISAIFRKGGDYKFMISELKEVIDPKGGWMGKSIGGHNGFIPSVVAEIANAIEYHVNKYCGQKKEVKGLDDNQKEFIANKVALHLKAEGVTQAEQITNESGVNDMKMPNATTCPVCKSLNAVIRIDNCPTCVSCGDSKCG